MNVFETPTNAFEWVYDKIMHGGISHRGTKAIIGYSMEILRPQHKVITTEWRKFNEDYAKKEWEWYLSGNTCADAMAEMAKIWKQCQDSEGNVNSNYGHHWFKPLYGGVNQYDWLLAELKNDKDSRRAILSHYDYNELHKYSKDTPCNLALQFVIVGHKLEVIIFCRSQDLVYGFCNDQYIWACLQAKIIKDLWPTYQLIPGRMVYQYGHIHIYPRHYNLSGEFKN